jgi:hypothetical protein
MQAGAREKTRRLPCLPETWRRRSLPSEILEQLFLASAFIS